MLPKNAKVVTNYTAQIGFGGCLSIYELKISRLHLYYLTVHL